MGKSQGIDALKGALILWVVIGHVAEVLHVEHIAFWIGSGIRMPLLVGVSGYLLNLERVRSAAFPGLAGRYWHRLLAPWLLACIVYMMMGGIRVDWATPLRIVLNSPYHLWYIPVLCSLILLTRLVRLPPVALMLLAGPITLATLGGLLLALGPVGKGAFAFDSRFLHFPYFFFLGMVLARRRKVPGEGWAALALAGVGALWWASLYESADPASRTFAQFIMMSGMVGLLPDVAALSLRIPVVVAIGRSSLFYYLWHPFVIGIAVVQGASAPVALAVSLICLILACWMLRRVPAIGRWFGVSLPSAQKAEGGGASGALSPLAPASGAALAKS